MILLIIMVSSLLSLRPKFLEYILKGWLEVNDHSQSSDL